jgi:hypothetical protein
MSETDNMYIREINEQVRQKILQHNIQQGIQQGKNEVLTHVAENLLKIGESRQFVKEVLGVTEKWLNQREGHFKLD